MRHRFAWAACYALVLAALSGYTLLDAFVIPKAYARVEEGTASVAQTAQTGSSADSGVSYSAHGSSAGEDGASADASVESSSDASAGNASAAAGTSSQTPQSTATSYVDENISINIQTLRVADTNVYVADVQVSSVEYLKTAFAQATYGRNVKDETSAIAEQAGAILAINGDFYGWRDYGYVLRNGQLYRDVAAGNDVLVVSGDGTMYAVSDSQVTAEELLAAGAWQVESFGPVLVDGGEVVVGESEEVGQAMRSNPRTAIGMVSPLHYVLVVSDGRTDENAGLSLYQLAQVMVDAGCSFAYNLDGGGSSTMWFQGELVNDPSSGRSSDERSVSDIVYIGY